MVRTIIKIDEERCDGCGLCAKACEEGAIGIVGGKAVLLRDDYCDGLGNCLPACPTGAIEFEEREAAEYDGEAVRANKESAAPDTLACGCPGTQSRKLEREDGNLRNESAPASHATHLNQWPVQIKLVPARAPYFDKARLLVAADCAAYAHGNFHEGFMKGCVTIIGCPKLDEGDYAEKLTAILKQNDVRSVTVALMEVPCCRGLENAVKTALKDCGKLIEWRSVVIGTDGRILGD